MRTDIDIPVAERLAKLLRLLASDRDGEVVAAVTALKKTLEGAGLDHHDLADMVTGKRGRGITQQERQNVEREAYRAGFRDGQRNAANGDGAARDDGRGDEDGVSWHDVATFCLREKPMARAARIGLRQEHGEVDQTWPHTEREAAKLARWT